jgi:ubiquitin C-terminal hydrolase
MNKFYPIKIRILSNFLFFASLLACDLYAAHTPGNIHPDLGRLLGEELGTNTPMNRQELTNRFISRLKNNPQMMMRIMARLKEMFANEPTDRAAPVFEESSDLLGKMSEPTIQGQNFEEFLRLFNDLSPEQRKKFEFSAQPKAADNKGPEVSMEFEGPGNVLCQDKDVIFDKAGDSHEGLEEKLDVLGRKFYLDDKIIQALKKAQLPSNKLEDFVNALGSKRSPREAREELNKFYQENKQNIDQISPIIRSNSVSLANTSTKISKPRVGAGLDEPRIIDINNFIEIGRKNGLEENKVRAFFEKIERSKMVEIFDFFKDLSPARAAAYIEDKSGSESKSYDDDQRFGLEDTKNAPILSVIKNHLAENKVDLIDINYILRLAEKLLRRTEPKIVARLCDIAGSLTGINRKSSENNITLERDLVDNLCTTMADKKISEKYLVQFYESLMIVQVRDKYIKWTIDNLKKITIDAFVDIMIRAFIKVEDENNHEKINPVDRGLKNNSNNCYLNSVMQVMAQLPAFVDNINKIFESSNYSPKMVQKNMMIKNLSHFFKGMKGEVSGFDKDGDASRNLRAFLLENGDAPQDDGRQQDSQETFSAIFNRATEGDELMAKDFEIQIEYTDTLIHDQFDEEKLRAFLEEEARAQGALGPEERLAKFVKRPELTSMLSLEIESEDVTDLNSCLAKYLNEEKIKIRLWPTTDGKDINIKKIFGYSFSARRTKKITKLPKILAIHLKRFYNKGEKLVKIDNSVSFPLKLDVNICNKAENFYDLCGAIFHGGPSIHFGHYWAFVKNLTNKEYYLYNDEIKELITNTNMETIGSLGQSKQAFFNGTAYMLFYEMHST